jgi:pentatricopeptide repeat protein
MEKVFQSLVADSRLNVTGVHWASLINAYGCVAKDLDKAITTFESIPTHPSTASRKNHLERLPDAITFEALVNVLIVHRRTDLLPKYTQQLKDLNIHMTAYIANALIKGYAAAGDLDQARTIFEGLLDPPVGVAAPHNHAPHRSAAPVPADAAVYREVSRAGCVCDGI